MFWLCLRWKWKYPHLKKKLGPIHACEQFIYRLIWVLKIYEYLYQINKISWIMEWHNTDYALRCRAPSPCTRAIFKRTKPQCPCHMVFYTVHTVLVINELTWTTSERDKLLTVNKSICVHQPILYLNVLTSIKCSTQPHFPDLTQNTMWQNMSSWILHYNKAMSLTVTISNYDLNKTDEAMQSWNTGPSFDRVHLQNLAMSCSWPLD